MKTLISGQRNRLLATLLSGLLMGMATLFSTSAMAQIAGTAHDFNDGLNAAGGVGDAWNTSGEICVVCHTPHSAISPTSGPLWNRSLTAVTNYTMYAPNTIPGSDIDGIFAGQPTGVSLLCLSCHDGTIAIDAFGGAAGGIMIDAINANANIGEGVGVTGDLSNDHPVAFTFPDVGPLPSEDDELYPNLGGVVNAIMPLFGGTQDQMECASCHDVHGTGNPYLLRVNNADSALCLTCHIK